MTNEEKVKKAFTDTIWMAIRYANGRHTYAPHCVRDAVALFREVYPEWKPNPDHTLEKPQDGWQGFAGALEGDWLHDLVEGGDSAEA